MSRSTLATAVARARLVLLVTMLCALYPFLLSSGPRCRASWSVWTRRTALGGCCRAPFCCRQAHDAFVMVVAFFRAAARFASAGEFTKRTKASFSLTALSSLAKLRTAPSGSLIAVSR